MKKKNSRPPKKPEVTNAVSSNGDDDPAYVVGKYRPPKDKQWKPGQSGNKKGRKKGSKNRKTIIRAAQRKTHSVTSPGGRRRKMTIDEIGIHNLLEEIKHRDRKAFLDWLEISDRYGDRNEAVASMQELRAEDRAIMANLLARKKHNSKREEDPK